MSSLTLDMPGVGNEQLVELIEPLPAGHTRSVISEGVRGTEQTIALMQQLVTKYKREDPLRELVGKVLNPKDGPRPCASKDYFCYAQKLYEWVRDNILYAYDPHLVEYIERPKILLKTRIGDCDSMVTTLCAAYESIGLQSQFVTIKGDPTRPDEYSHVYCRVMIPRKGWVVADPTMNKWFGWEPQGHYQKRYWPASQDDSRNPLDTQDSLPVASGVSGLRGMDDAPVIKKISALDQIKRTDEVVLAGDEAMKAIEEKIKVMVPGAARDKAQAAYAEARKKIELAAGINNELRKQHNRAVISTNSYLSSFPGAKAHVPSLAGDEEVVVADPAAYAAKWLGSRISKTTLALADKATNEAEKAIAAAKDATAGGKLDVSIGIGSLALAAVGIYALFHMSRGSK